ncbi:MAG TPA: HAMP domain-containing sensor histidine kinase [Solirubrobacterales bacterium]|nr:HAMP domain-containing sensor histidine kinase [Solirubrobacterales bacterium]
MEAALAEVAAGLPMALSVALAGGISTLRESRRRSALNEAMHELRRPLQVLSLSLPDDSGGGRASLQMATAALDRLDREVNGGPAASGHRAVDLGPLLRVVVERWRARAAQLERPLRLRCGDFGATLVGDEIQIAQAVDNLISNAIEHGAGTVTVEAVEQAGLVRIAVLDGGLADADQSGPRVPLRARLSGRSRHGHGLRVVGRVARAHGGTFRLRRSASRTEARLELPLQQPEARG